MIMTIARASCCSAGKLRERRLCRAAGGSAALASCSAVL
jgi:hypothetical protein